MKCVICHGENIISAEVREELHIGNDIVSVPVRVLLCRTCGERYYDRRAMQYLEKVEADVAAKVSDLPEIGKVLAYEPD